MFGKSNNRTQNGFIAHSNPAIVPQSPGGYVLLDASGQVIYVGKASNLRERLLRHFGENETNPLIRLFISHFVAYVTSTVTEAEECEGRLFDLWLRATGRYPEANINRPPRSGLSNEEDESPLVRALAGRRRQPACHDSRGEAAYALLHALNGRA